MIADPLADALRPLVRRWALPAVVLAILIGVAMALASTWPVAAQDPPSEPPERPTGLTGTVKHNQVSLTWDDPDDDSITGYQILRRNRDTDPGARYAYCIKARNAAGLSSWRGSRGSRRHRR